MPSSHDHVITDAPTRTETVIPDAESLDAFGRDMMNPATRPPAARAGFAQGTALAQELSRFWV